MPETTEEIEHKLSQMKRSFTKRQRKKLQNWKTPKSQLVQN